MSFRLTDDIEARLDATDDDSEASAELRQLLEAGLDATRPGQLPAANEHEKGTTTRHVTLRLPAALGDRLDARVSPDGQQSAVIRGLLRSGLAARLGGEP